MESGKRTGVALLASVCAVAVVFVIIYAVMAISLGIDAPLANFYVSLLAVGFMIPGLFLLSIFCVIFPKVQFRIVAVFAVIANAALFLYKFGLFTKPYESSGDTTIIRHAMQGGAAGFGNLAIVIALSIVALFVFYWIADRVQHGGKRGQVLQ